MSIKYANKDRYTDANGVLLNKLGIADADALEAAEADIAAVRVFDIRKKAIKGNLDLKHLQAIHQYVFQDIYDWAGELRDVNISKDGSMFAAFNHITAAAEPIFQQLSEERFLTGLAPKAFSKRAAWYLSELNALHPFREGNGRAQREFMNHVAAKSGYIIRWENAAPAETLNAFIASFKGELSPLTALIQKHLEKIPSTPSRPASKSSPR